MHFRVLLARFLALALVAAPLRPQQPYAQSPIVGTWELLTFESRDSLHAVSYPLGKRPKGILIYGRDGRVAVQLFDPDRPRFASPDRAAGTDDEIRAAFNGSFAYYGRYSVDSTRGIVTHRIEGASFPNWIGTDFIRQYHLDADSTRGDRLTITTTPQLVAGRRVVTALVWRRAR